jgi:cysteine desulfurase family protein
MQMAIYLDNAATSFPKPPAVYEQMIACLQNAGANPGRSGHRMARAAQKIIEQTRWQLARLIGADQPARIIFTFNATDALNIALKGLLSPGDHIITTKLEHNSVLRPLRRLATRGAEISLIDFDTEGFIAPADIEAAIRPQTKLIALTSASNLLGSLQPIEAVGEIARQHNLIFLVDGAQTVGIVPIDVEAMRIDLLAASGHKALLGPPGTGLLYVGARAQLACWREGGTGGDSLSPLQPMAMPFHLEAGTHNFSGIAGLGAALDYINGTGIDNLRKHELRLIDRLIKGLGEIPAARVYGPLNIDRRVGVAAFALAGYRADEVAAILDESFDIAVRAGLHCAPLAHEALGALPDGLTRVSVGPFNSEADIDSLIAALREMV